MSTGNLSTSSPSPFSFIGAIQRKLNISQTGTSSAAQDSGWEELAKDEPVVINLKKSVDSILNPTLEASASSKFESLSSKAEAFVEPSSVTDNSQSPLVQDMNLRYLILNTQLELFTNGTEDSIGKKQKMTDKIELLIGLVNDKSISNEIKAVALKQLDTEKLVVKSLDCGLQAAIETLQIAKEEANNSKDGLLSTVQAAKQEMVQEFAEAHIAGQTVHHGSATLEAKRLVFLASEMCGYSCEELTEDEKKYIVEPSKCKKKLEAFLVKAKHGTELYHVARHESIKCAQKLSIEQNETALVMHERKPGHSLGNNFERLTVNENNSKELCLLSGMTGRDVGGIMSANNLLASSESTLEGRCFYQIANNLAGITEHKKEVDWCIDADAGDERTLAMGESMLIRTDRKMHFYVVFNSHTSGGMETTVRRPISINDLRHSEGIFSESPEVIRTMVNQAVAQTSDCQQLIDFANSVIFNSLCNYQMNAHKAAREGFAVMREAFTAALQAKLKNSKTLDEITRYVYDTGNGVGSEVPKPEIRDEWVAICNHPAITAIQLKSQFNKSAPFKHNHIPTITVDVAEEFSNEELTSYFSEEVRDLMFREAVIYNKRLLADKLQKAGAKVAKCDSLGFYPVSLAAMHGHKDTLDFLKSARKVKFSQADSEKRSTTYLAARFNHPEALSYLLTFNTLAGNPNDQATDGDTPLLSATRMGHTKICNILVADTRVKLNPTGFNNQNVLHVCCMQGNQALHDLFEEKRSNEYKSLISSYDSNHRTPRMCALQNGHKTLANKINH